MKIPFFVVVAFALVFQPGGRAANAATIDWTTWSSQFTPGTIAGTATGTGGISYSGELVSVYSNYPSFTPSSTFRGGTIDNAPPPSGNILQLSGGTGSINTISF